ncbi:MAG: glycosyltransferase family 1 protein [Ignavibacteriales bacterium]|nr:glycosyltransferase family 1 protein [Ignavibacteriales bacterium]
MANITIDARKYFDFGIGSYIQNLASALSGMRTKHAFTLLASALDIGRIEAPDGWRKEQTDFGKYSIGEIALLGRKALASDTELFHEPHFTLPSGLKGRSVVTIHDLIHLKMPQYFSAVQRGYAAMMIGYAVRNAGAIIVDSQKTKDDILGAFRISEDSVEVVYLGVHAAFRQLEDRSTVERFRVTHGVHKPFVLFVGNVKPHKNIPALLSAFAQVQAKVRDIDLVFVGGSFLADAKLVEQARALGIIGAIHDLNRISESELVAAYNAAELVVLPSFYEGFGFPPLESMACGTPVVVSTGGSLPEVVGEAATIIDPSRPEELAEAIRRTLEDSQKRTVLIEKGKKRAAGFTWQKTGEKTLAIYEKVLDRCRRN